MESVGGVSVVRVERAVEGLAWLVVVVEVDALEGLEKRGAG